jgi:hypothetical protein
MMMQDGVFLSFPFCSFPFDRFTAGCRRKKTRTMKTEFFSFFFLSCLVYKSKRNGKTVGQIL